MQKKMLLISGAAPSKPAAAAPAPAAAAPPTPTPPPIAAAPAAARPMTAVEQHFGDRVYASPMAKRLAEAQALRLEGMFHHKCDAKSANIDVASAFCRQRKRCIWIDHKQRSWFIVRRRWRSGPSRTNPNRCRIHRYSSVEYARHHRQALAGIEGYNSALLPDGRCQC